jgi:poly(3-hydroxyalkanoate) depolymerase
VTTADARQRTFVRVDGSVVRVSIRGQGPPLLLIMGLGGNIEMWDPLERALVDHGFQTIAYDAPGTGESPPRLVPRRMSGLARHAAHLLDALALPRVDVLGVSFGGAVAQELALHNPHRVRRLVLAGTTCGLGSVPGHPLALAALVTPLRYYSPRFFRLVAPLLYGPGTAGDDRMLRAHVASRQARPPSLCGYVGQLGAAAGWTSLPWLHHVRAPTLVVSGDRDRVVPPVNARILAARLPNARRQTLDGGHVFLLENPRTAATAIARFLDTDEEPLGGLASHRSDLTSTDAGRA